MVKYSIERLSARNFKDLHALYQTVFNKKISLDFLQQKYSTSFAGASFIGYLAFAPDQSPAAFYGVLPCRFRIRGETLLAAQSADTMTHPLHRKTGLFLQLATETYKLARQNDIEFIFGFPNRYSMGGFIKLNWKFAKTPMKMFTMKANPVPFSGIIRKISILDNVYSALLKRIYQCQNHELLPFDNAHDGVTKDQAFVDYKSYGGSYFIKIDEVRLWIKLDSTLKIGYVEVTKMTSPERLLKKIHRMAFLSGCSNIIFITSVNTPLYNVLSGLAMPADSYPIGFYNITNRELDFDNVRFEYCDIDTF